MSVPQGLERSYSLSTNYGMVLAPESTAGTQESITVELGSGNITITEE